MWGKFSGTFWAIWTWPRGPYDRYTPEQLKQVLAEYGLTAISAHVDIEDTDKMLEYLPGTGAKYIVCPGLHSGGGL